MLEAGKSKVRVLARARFLVPSSLVSSHGRRLCGTSFMRPLIPFMMPPPSCPRGLLKSSPPNTITMVVRIQHVTVSGDGHKHSVCNINTGKHSVSDHLAMTVFLIFMPHAHVLSVILSRRVVLILLPTISPTVLRCIQREIDKRNDSVLRFF